MFRERILSWVGGVIPPGLGGEADYVLVADEASVGEDEAVLGFAFAELSDHFRDCLGTVRVFLRERGGGWGWMGRLTCME